MVVFSNLIFSEGRIFSNVKYMGAVVAEGYASYDTSSGHATFSANVESYVLLEIESAFRKVNLKYERGKLKNGDTHSIAWG